jgi:hypothetical protein
MVARIGLRTCDMEKPQTDYPLLRIVRFADKFLRDGVETQGIEGVSVPSFGVA